MNEDILIKGFRRISDTEDGSMCDAPNDWTGILSMLLRKMVKDMYDGKGMEGCMQFQKEDITYSQMEEMIERFILRYYGDDISESELKAEKSRLMTEFSRDSISIKVLGEFLMVLDLEWVDIRIVAGRKSGTVKSYTKHIGGIGTVQYQEPENTEAYFKQSGIHNEPIPMPKSIVEKKKTKEKKPRKRRGSSAIEKGIK